MFDWGLNTPLQTIKMFVNINLKQYCLAKEKFLISLKQKYLSTYLELFKRDIDMVLNVN